MWGDFGEVFHMGNKETQAKDRAFKLTRYSIELAPEHEKAEWDIKNLTMTHIPTHSFIQALAVNAAGSAGGNQRLTTWTEAHGYVYDEHKKMWTEMQPVPNQFYSQRFVETYAGYENESMLLFNLWQMGEAGERLHDEYPIFGNETAGLIAYIDQGEEARRMPWQQGEAGRQYYAEQAAVEEPQEYSRLHENRWVSNVNALIPMPLWNRLVVEDMPPPEHGEIIVVAVDASVSNDCTALVVVAIKRVSRPARWGDDEDVDPEEGMLAREIETYVWEPEHGEKLDYRAKDGLKDTFEDVLSRFRVACVAYDEYQLHDFMTTYKKKYGRKIDFYAFPQGGERLEADTMLVNRIKQERIIHTGNPVLTAHIANSDGKRQIGEKKLRIVKRNELKKIDAAVALSMAIQKAFELAPQRRGGRIY